MAHIQLGPHSLAINGIDYSMEVMPDVELVSVGDDEFAQVGFRVTFLVGRLDLDDQRNVVVTGHFPEVAQLVASIAATDSD